MPSPHAPLPNPVAKAAPPNQNQTTKKLRAAPTKSSSPGAKPPQHDQQQALIKCPRCDSSSTKFCYYNNYSLAQPRHFCKTCRRYWTKGGSLRNIPVGGGSHMTKRLKSSSSSSSSKDFPADVCGLNLSQVVSPALEFQLGGIELPRVNAPNAPTGVIYNTEYPILGEGSPSSILGSLDFPIQIVIPPKQPQAPTSLVVPPSLTLKIGGNLVSSIESLSCINQDLHRKLHQQRLAALYADSIPLDGQSPSSRLVPQLGNIANGSNSAPLATEWFFWNSALYASVTPSPTDGHGNENTSCNNWHHRSNNNNGNSNSGAAVIRCDRDQAWGR